MERLSEAERRIARTMLIKQFGSGTLFLDQLAEARVEERRLTGVGIFVELAVPPIVAPIDRVNATITAVYETTLRSPCDLVGFALFIRDGFLSLLEGYTFCDAIWPDQPLEDWLKIAQVEPVALRVG